MSTFLAIPHFLETLTLKGVRDSVAKSIFELRFGPLPSGPKRIAHKLATSVELRTIPPGFLEIHQVLVPKKIPLKSEEDILARLEHMVNTVRDKKAINAILRRVVVPGTTGKAEKEYAFRSPGLTNLARDLVRERSRDEQFVDNLLRGYLGECAQALAEGTVKIAPTTARNLLIDLSILWGLHDLQIIACRLFQDTMRPTGGCFEGTDMRPQTLDGLRTFAVKCGKHFTTMLNLSQPGDPSFTGPDKDPEFKKDMKSLIGFGTGADVSETIKFYAQMLGYSESDINDKNAPITEDERKFFRDVAREGISKADTIVRESEKTFQGRGGTETKSYTAKRLHAGSLRDGMRPEAALSYAIITFVHMVIDLPGRIDRFVETRDREALTSATLTPHNLTSIRSISGELIDVFRAIYLWDANYLDKKLPSLRTQTPTGKKRLTASQVRQVLIELQSDRLRDGHENNSGISMTKGLAKDMYNDAINILKAEQVLPDQRQSKPLLNALPPDPKLAPALPWRFACTRANVPQPDLTRPFVPEH